MSKPPAPLIATPPKPPPAVASLAMGLIRVKDPVWVKLMDPVLLIKISIPAALPGPAPLGSEGLMVKKPFSPGVIELLLMVQSKLRVAP